MRQGAYPGDASARALRGHVRALCGPAGMVAVDRPTVARSSKSSHCIIQFLFAS